MNPSPIGSWRTTVQAITAHLNYGLKGMTSVFQTNKKKQKKVKVTKETKNENT